MITLESVAPDSRMKTALVEPVSASELHLCPRSYSLLPRSTLPLIVDGLESATTEPTRVGMLRVPDDEEEDFEARSTTAAEVPSAMMAATIVVVNRILAIEITLFVYIQEEVVQDRGL